MNLSNEKKRGRHGQATALVNLMFEVGTRVKCITDAWIPNRIGFLGTAVAVSGRRIKVLFDCDRLDGDPLTGENLAKAGWYFDIEIEYVSDLPYEACLLKSYQILAYLCENKSRFRWDAIREHLQCDENLFRNAMVHLLRNEWVRCSDEWYWITALGHQKFYMETL